MGPKQSMLEAAGHHKLSKEEFDHVTKVFKQVCKQPETGMTYSEFETFCSDLHPLLVKFILRFYFGHNRDLTLKTPHEFVSLYAYLVRGGSEERTKSLELLLFDVEESQKTKRRSTLSGAMCNPRKLHVIQVKFNISGETFRTMLQNYLIGLICTYMKLENSTGGEEFRSWRKVRARFSAEDVEKFALALEDDCEQPHETSQLEKWVRKWRSLNHLHAYVYDYLFKFEQPLHRDSIHSLFPLCHTKYCHNVCLMDMCSIMYVNTYLPNLHTVKWRLLFSSILHGMSYKHMLERIVDEGATLVVIHDKENYIFGGYAPHSWTPSNKFFGSHQAFVFQLQPDLKIFLASGENSNYQFMKNSKTGKLGRGLGMGGEDFGWWINPDEHTGTASPCDTFRDLPIIASSGHFRMEFIEVWGLDPNAESKEDANKAPKANYSSHHKDKDSNLHRAGKVLRDHAAGHGGYSGKAYSDGYSTEARRHPDRETEKRGDAASERSSSDWEDINTEDSASSITDRSWSSRSSRGSQVHRASGVARKKSSRAGLH